MTAKKPRRKRTSTRKGLENVDWSAVAKVSSRSPQSCKGCGTQLASNEECNCGLTAPIMCTGCGAQLVRDYAPNGEPLFRCWDCGRVVG